MVVNKKKYEEGFEAYHQNLELDASESQDWRNGWWDAYQFDEDHEEDETV